MVILRERVFKKMRFLEASLFNSPFWTNSGILILYLQWPLTYKTYFSLHSEDQSSPLTPRFWQNLILSLFRVSKMVSAAYQLILALCLVNLIKKFLVPKLFWLLLELFSFLADLQGYILALLRYALILFGKTFVILLCYKILTLLRQEKNLFPNSRLSMPMSYNILTLLNYCY